MQKNAKTKAATAGKLGVDASIVALVTTILITLLRDNGVEISGAIEEMILFASLLICGRFAAWMGGKIRAAGERKDDE
jgi:hypothetical protein